MRLDVRERAVGQPHLLAHQFRVPRDFQRSSNSLRVVQNVAELGVGFHHLAHPRVALDHLSQHLRVAAHLLHGATHHRRVEHLTHHIRVLRHLLLHLGQVTAHAAQAAQASEHASHAPRAPEASRAPEAPEASSKVPTARRRRDGVSARGGGGRRGRRGRRGGSRDRCPAAGRGTLDQVHGVLVRESVALQRALILHHVAPVDQPLLVRRDARLVLRRERRLQLGDGEAQLDADRDPRPGRRLDVDGRRCHPERSLTRAGRLADLREFEI